MRDLIEVSYTGDILAHRRCRRAWAYEKHVGFQPYEQVQAMEGRLVHHAMEWMTSQFTANDRKHVSVADCREQLERYYRVLRARGIRTRFESREDVLNRVLQNLFPKGTIDRTIAAVIEGAVHSEYEVRAIRQLIPARAGGKSKLLLTGILDLVVQQQMPLRYEQTWSCKDEKNLVGDVLRTPTVAKTNDIEVWDYKATRGTTEYLDDYVRQLLTYAAIYRERTGALPARCVLFFINEKNTDRRLVAIPVTNALVEAALEWTHTQVELLQQTVTTFTNNPAGIDGGELELAARATGQRSSQELEQQCTTCGLRFDCKEYTTVLAKRTKSNAPHPDVNRLNVFKN